MAGKLMHAVQHDQAGLKHVEVPVSSPSKDEVLLKIEAASINPVDWRIRKGLLRLILPRIPRDLIQPFEVCPELLNLGALIPDAYFRHVPREANRAADWVAKSHKTGNYSQQLVTDVAGEVVAIGSGVKNFKAGDKVVAMLRYFKYEGGLAEFAAAKESMTVPRPPEVSAAEGAGLPVAALTAHQALTQSAGLKLDGTSTQTNILITAASGGVGHYAVQLAKLGNMHVTATCGARNIDFVKSLGADEVLDYKTPDGEALKSPSGKKYDAVIHCATTGIPWSTFEPNLSSNGKVIDMTPTPIAMLTYVVKKVTFAKKHLVLLFMVPKRDNLDYLVKLVKEGKLKTVIDSRYPLGKAEDAWAKSIDGHATGKIIVDMLA